jgi:hypothetical protein
MYRGEGGGGVLSNEFLERKVNAGHVYELVMDVCGGKES